MKATDEVYVVVILDMMLSNLDNIQEWSAAKTVVAVETISSKDNDPNRSSSAEWRYFLSSHKSSDKRLPS